MEYSDSAEILHMLVSKNTKWVTSVYMLFMHKGMGLILCVRD